MEQKIKTTVVGTYNGHSVRQNQNLDIALKCRYDEMENYIKMIQFLNVDTTIAAKLPDEAPMKLGTFRVKEIKIDNDGEGQLKFTTLCDYADTDNINKLIGTEAAKFQFSAMVEIEEDNEPEFPEEDV
jgi:hypothetical protein